jgi:hypothetical protein
MLRSDHFSSGWALATALLVPGAPGACKATSPSASQAVMVLVKAHGLRSPGQSAGPVEITGVRLVIGEVALGNGDQFGCVDCQGDQQDENPQPLVVTVPVDGSPVSVAAERVRAGHYSAVEMELVPPSPALLAATPGWSAGSTIEVRGRYNGTDFTLPLAIPGQFREALSPPIDVPAGGLPGPINVTITLPVASWFSNNGTPLDPADATARALIAAKARASVTPGNETEKEGAEH